MTTNPNSLDLGTNTVTITANASGTTNTGTVTATGKYCNVADNGNLKISIEDIKNLGFSNNEFGDDEEWFPLDEIEVEIDVENDGNENIDNIVVEWGLYNLATNEWYVDDEENDFKLKDGKRETLIINFKLDDNLDELEDGNFIFYVKATGEDDEFDGNDTCVSDSESIDVMMEDDFVVLDDIEFSEVVSCGAELSITADVWNTGLDDQNDVYVFIYNKELGFSEKVEMGDIDAFENEKLDVNLIIPEDAEEKDYFLNFMIYDDDDDIYENQNDDKAEFGMSLKIEGNCGEASAEEVMALVSATLESGGKSGEELVVKVIVTNIGDELASYELNAAGYAEWATSADIDQKILLLNAGESGETFFRFDVKEGVEGEKLFNVEVLSGNKLLEPQPVSVTIEKSGFKFPGKEIFGDNLYLWGIGLLNIILVVIIIIVAIRVAKK